MLPTALHRQDRRQLLKLSGLLPVSYLVSTVWAQNTYAGWPQGKAITLFVGYPPGGSTDMVARTIGEAMGKRLGATVVIENAAGAGGTIAAQKVVSAAPDGYTLLLGSGSEISIARLFNSAVRYNGETDLSHIGLIGSTPMVLLASPKLGIKSLDDVISKSKTEPKRYSFASSGVGTPLHISGELLNMMGGSNLRHVPYRGAAQQMQDLIGGNIEYSMSVLSSAMPHIESGKATAVAVTTSQRARVAPQVPTMSEHPRLKGYDMNVWFGLFGPAKLPAPMIARLNQALNDCLRDPDVWKKLQAGGISNEGGSPAQLSQFIRAETHRVKSVITRVVATGFAS
ncbi:tripartite tricarboxylate transporter substrate-binding protein [Variovorax sp. PCZ-1]|uniref:Bug family tripartite tricarboxylate transporter substrate binding protein n=1 Tax=Variovorax sp. PCZ-1 TaxID=2835533 RepID=UPI001BCBF64A|nr:tripartite tricarboxylate transporter substrate-binding protein [Variovorax sp. PCZ-1]MBS7808672.1 tripartite tricarboxylate transporter substrate binding protein [Variovorax sp. PCZ-1]